MQRILLALILVLGLVLRVWHNDYGLPYIWGVDEGTHFASRAVDMFREGFDPGYYQNPAGYTYTLFAVLRVMYGPLGVVFDLPWGNVTEQFNKDPGQIWVVARSLAAVLAFAFLPVSYSRIAVTDVGALIWVALSTLGSVRALERGRLRDYALAGSAAGLALAF